MRWPSRAAPPQARAIPLTHALTLGVLQGPTELLPISSSAHLALAPWLLRWDSAADDELRKAFEVTLHVAAAPALAATLRKELLGSAAQPWPRRFGLLGLSLTPSVVVGYLLERPIERHLRAPPTVALGFLAGGLALAWADRGSGTRRREESGPRDALWLGFAQACALFPGVSRGGATLTAARMRGFARADAHGLSRELALPVIVAAAVLKGMRLRARRLPPPARLPFVIGALAAFGSTLASGPLLKIADGDRPLAPYAAYRIALATAVLARWRAARAPSSRLRLPGDPGRTISRIT